MNRSLTKSQNHRTRVQNKLVTKITQKTNKKNTQGKEKDERTHHDYKNGGKPNTKLERNSLMGIEFKDHKLKSLSLSTNFYSPTFTSHIYSFRTLFFTPFHSPFLSSSFFIIAYFILKFILLSFSFYNNTCF